MPSRSKKDVRSLAHHADGKGVRAVKPGLDCPMVPASQAAASPVKGATGRCKGPGGSGGAAWESRRKKRGWPNRGCCAWSEERSDERSATGRCHDPAVRIKPSFFAYLAVIVVAALVVLIVWKA